MDDWINELKFPCPKGNLPCTQWHIKTPSTIKNIKTSINLKNIKPPLNLGTHQVIIKDKSYHHHHTIITALFEVSLFSLLHIYLLFQFSTEPLWRWQLWLLEICDATAKSLCSNIANPAYREKIAIIRWKTFPWGPWTLKTEKKMKDKKMQVQMWAIQDKAVQCNIKEVV